MQIVHIDTGPEMRGGQYQVLLLLDGLAEGGYDQILLAKESSPLRQAAKVAGHHVCPATLYNVWRWSRLSNAVVHAHDARAHTLAALVPGIRLVVSRRVAFPLKRSVPSRWKYGRAKRYLAVSCFVRDVLISSGIPPAKVDVVHDGVELPSADASWSVEGPIVALASSDPGKGRDLMQQAAALAEVDVLYSGDLLRDLRRASMFVYLTRSEGLGSAALLAMSRGVPVIASRVEGLAEVFIHNESGLYVRNNAEEVAGAIRRLRNDRELARCLAQGGRARIEERFTKEHMVNGTIGAYKRVLAP
ncbi:MAG: glycosyltransferase family 4 protein [Acidobacteriaceae bacterium]|nr:glycosyltransferase family 4 protein [Acidobacteriaceae bacterium]